MKQLFLMAGLIFFSVPFFVFGQSEPDIPHFPAFMKDVTSQEDFEKLTDIQKKEAEEFFKNSPIGPTLASPQIDAQKGTVNCFGYYTFGSVQVDIEPTVGGTVPGVPITFTGKLKNDNPYPLVDGAVMIKIFKTDGGDDDLTHQNGYPVVDQFFAVENVSISAKGESPISFDWTIPAFAQSGDYQAAAYFMTAKRFNLLGLPFTDDVTGNTANFSIASGEATGVWFDKNAVTLNDQQYRFAAFPPHFTKNESIKAEVKLQNTTDKPQTVQLAWILFNWAGEREENQLDQKTETITLKPNETKALSYTATKATGSVSFLNIEANYQDTKSILNIRFVRDGFDETRINFPSVMKYPLAKGESNALFSCLHSTNAPIVNDGELTLTLKDTEGNLIHSYTYQGGVTGAMMGVKDDFTPSDTYVDFTLTATLKNKGNVVEEVTEKYSCKDIDPSLCPKRGLMIDSASGADRGVIMAVVLTLLALLALLGWKIWKDRRRGNGSGMMPVLFAMLFAGALLFGGAGEAEAKSTSVQRTFLGGFYYQVTSSSWTSTYPWFLGLVNPSITGLYHANVYNEDTNALIPHNSSVPVGTRLRFETTLGEISFSGTGKSSDTPFGVWKADAGFPDGPTYLYNSCAWPGGPCFPFRGAGCSPQFLTTDNGFYKIYTPLSVHPPIPTIFRDSASAARLSCSGNVCTVSAPGAINTDFIFPETYGKFWYEYTTSPTNPNQGYPGCHIPWDIVSMKFSENPELNYNNNPNFPAINPSGNPDSFSVPSATITYSLIATQSNALPASPDIKGSADMSVPAPLSGASGSPVAFHFLSTDPDTDTIRYGIDWDNNNSVDQWVPSSGYVNSGTSQTASRTWANPGVYTFKVLAQDSKGGDSGWRSHTITISNPVPIPVITGFTATPAFIVTGNSSTLAWTTTNAQSCWISGGGIDSWTTVPNGNRNVSPVSTTTYSLECWNSASVSSGVRTATVTVTAAACVPTYSYVCLQTGGNCTAATCGQTLATAPDCVKINSCGGQSSVLPSECVSNGVACSGGSVACPACPPSSTGNWMEVMPGQ